jgi:uncharacterized membrane protein YfcA
VKTLLLLALVGLGAQLLDGSLGMAYGVTSTTFLLLLGANPAAASATIHLAEIGTTLSSGVSHWRFGNVDWRVVAKIGIPGMIGSFTGATLLAHISTAVATPLMSLILLGLGLYLLLRFTFRGFSRRNLGKPLYAAFLSPLGLVAGFVDALGGGGWGPIGTSSVLASGRLEPRKVVGSIDTSKFLVSTSASLGFLTSLGFGGVDFRWVGGLLLGGVVAAPIAAFLVRRMPPRLLGSLVGGLLVLTNVRSLLRSDLVGASVALQWVAYAAIGVLWAAAFAWSLRAHLRERAAGPAVAPAADGSARVAEPVASVAGQQPAFELGR